MNALAQATKPDFATDVLDACQSLEISAFDSGFYCPPDTAQKFCLEAGTTLEKALKAGTAHVAQMADNNYWVYLGKL